jgi:hypothetical protein
MRREVAVFDDLIYNLSEEALDRGEVRMVGRRRVGVAAVGCWICAVALLPSPSSSRSSCPGVARRSL